MELHPPSFTLRQLAYFVAAADEGTVVGAAQRMNVAPSTLSDAVTELERQLDVQLSVRRKSRGFTLTSEGEQVVEWARGLLKSANELKTSLQSSQEELAGPVSVGAFPTISPTVLPSILADFQASYPRVHVDFLEASHDELFELLESSRLNFAIVNDTYLPENLARRKLFELTTYLLLPITHRLADAPYVAFEDVIDEDFIMLETPPSTDHALTHFAKRGLTPKVRYRTRNVELVRRLVAKELGYGLLIHRDFTAEQLHEFGVVVKEIYPPIAPFGTYIVWSPKNDLTARAVALIDFLQTVDWSSATAEA